MKVGDTIGYVTSIGISTPLISKFSGVIEEILVKMEMLSTTEKID